MTGVNEIETFIRYAVKFLGIAIAEVPARTARRDGVIATADIKPLSLAVLIEKSLPHTTCMRLASLTTAMS